MDVVTSSSKETPLVELSQRSTVTSATTTAASMTHHNSFVLLSDESLSIDTSTDGVDILAAEPPAENFLQYAHQRAGAVVTSPVFKRAVLGTILVNCAVLAMRTVPVLRMEEHYREGGGEDGDDEEEGQALSIVLLCDWIIHACLICFTVEMLLEITHFQGKLWQKGWVLLDILLIGGSWFFYDSLAVLRGFRLLRALRKATGWTAVRDTVKAFLYALPRLLVLTAMYASILLMFAVLFTDLYLRRITNDADTDQGSINDQDVYFARVTKSALTLFQAVTGGRVWSEITTDLEVSNPGSIILFVAYICIALYFGGLSVAVQVQALQAVWQDSREFGGGGNKLSRASKRSLLWEASERSATSGTKEMTSHHSCSDDFATTLQQQQQRDTISRLEQKVDELTTTVEQLLGMQVSLQQSMQSVAEQHGNIMDKVQTISISTRDDVSFATANRSL